MNPEAAAQAAAEDAERRAAPRAEARRPAPVRAAAPAPAPETGSPTPRAALPAAAPAPPPAPVAATPEAQPEAVPAETAAEPTQTREESGAPMWPLALIAALIVAAGAFFLMRRRREPTYEEYVEEPVYVEPVVAAPVGERAKPAAAVAAAGVMVDDRELKREEPVGTAESMIVSGAAPVVADASLEAASSEDVAALTAVDAPADRPWLEFGFRPIRAGANVDEALVEIELTVANAGNVPAEDVRISTFMLPAGNDSEMERLLIENHDDTATAVTIPAGEGTRVDATLATSRAALVNGADHAAFQPVIVADARYRLPDGSEGRTSASFVVGATSDGGVTLEPLSLDRPLVREDVAAHLYREPERV